MRIFALLFLIGVASASFHEMLDNASEEFVLQFLEGMESSGSLIDHFAELDGEHANMVEDEIKTEIGKRLKEVLNKVLYRVKTAIEEGKVVREEFLEKIKELREQLKSLKLEVGEKGKAILEKIREKARDYLKKLLEKLDSKKRAADDCIEEALAELNVKEMLKILKEHLKKTVEPELLKEKIEKIFGQGSELLDQLLQVLKEKGKTKMMMLIDFILGDEEEAAVAHGISDYWDKVKNYFKDLKIDLQEKYSKFGKWVKDTLDNGMEKSKDKFDNIRAIALEFAKHAKGISKEIAAEAGEFFKNYKDELGILWDEIKEKIQEVKNRQD